MQHQHIVLAGWLGCTERKLEKYASLYKSVVDTSNSAAVKNDPDVSGITTIHTVIAPPKAVIEASMMEDSPSIRNLVLHVLEEIMAVENRGVKNTSRHNVIFHAFSNGGCFVYEQFRDILVQSSISGNQENRYRRVKVIGVVFDSCPASYRGGYIRGQGLERAMMYTSKLEQIYLRLLFLFTKKSDYKVYVDRAAKFWNRMQSNFDFSIPELYLYGSLDTLAPFEPLYDLVKYRQKMTNLPILSILFEKSPHCCHILSQPHTYEIAVKNFFYLCQNIVNREETLLLTAFRSKL